MKDLEGKSVLKGELTPQTKRSIGLGSVLTSTDFLRFQSLGLNNFYIIVDVNKIESLPKKNYTYLWTAEGRDQKIQR